MPPLQCARKSHGYVRGAGSMTGAHLEDFTQSRHCADCRNKAAFVGLALVDKILILRRPVKGAWGICLCKKECLWPLFCYSSPCRCSEFPPLFNPPTMDTWMCGTLSISAPAGDLCAPCLATPSDLQLETQVGASWPHW